MNHMTYKNFVSERLAPF